MLAAAPVVFIVTVTTAWYSTSDPADAVKVMVATVADPTFTLTSVESRAALGEKTPDKLNRKTLPVACVFVRDAILPLPVPLTDVSVVVLTTVGVSVIVKIVPDSVVVRAPAK